MIEFKKILLQRIKHKNMSTHRIAIIGCGNLGTALLKGFTENNNNKDSIHIIATKRDITDIKHLAQENIEITTDNAYALKNANIIIFTLKPFKIIKVLEELKVHLNKDRHILVSAATAVSFKDINEVLQLNIPLFRVMPNTAADVGQSITCISANAANESHTKLIKKLFNKIGSSIVIDEDLMQSATILGACGIAYVLRFIRAMIQGGIQIGFDSKTANDIVTQTVKGAASLLIENHEHPEFEIDKVTTPKGCTIVGLNEMEHNGFSSSLIKGIVKSYNEIS